MSDAYLIYNNPNEGVFSNQGQFDFIPGKFEYISDSYTRESLVSAYETINSLDLWDYIRVTSEYGLLSDVNFMRKIVDLLKNFGQKYRTFDSFSSSIRNLIVTLKFIAVKGEEEFIKKQV
jgi:hypothetical protein